MMQIWNGYTEFFDEIVDTFASAGINYEIKGNEILVDKKDYNEAYGILCELNSLLEAGW
jgi:hypothetical protein